MVRSRTQSRPKLPSLIIIFVLERGGGEWKEVGGARGEISFLFSTTLCLYQDYLVHNLYPEQVKSFSEDGDQLTIRVRLAGKPHIRVVRVFSRWEKPPPVK